MKVEKIITKIEEINITGATLLSVDEAEVLPERLRKYTKWWWLRSQGSDNFHATSVYCGGVVYYYGYYIDIDNFAVRPALKFDNFALSNFYVGDRFVFGGKEFEVINDGLAFCLSDIGLHRFDGKSNNYENSEIKQFVDDWFTSCVEGKN